MIINKSTRSVKISGKVNMGELQVTGTFWYRAALCLLLLGGTVRAEKELVGQQGWAEIWAAGDEAGVYLAVAKQENEDQGFRIYQRDKIAARFLPGQWYQGRIADVIKVDDRLMVFLSQGACQSYDLYTSQTERRLPEGLTFISGAYENDHLYVLARAEGSVILSLPSIQKRQFVPEIQDTQEAISNNNETPDANMPVFQPEAQNKETLPEWSFGKGDLVLMRHGADNRWQMVSAEVPAIFERQNKPMKIGVLDEVVYLFGITEGYLQNFVWNEKKLAGPEILSIKNVAAVTVLRINRQIRIVVAASPEAADKDIQGEDEQEKIFQIGWQVQGGWQFSDPLKKNSKDILQAQPSQVSFASLGQNIAVFARKGEKTVLFGQYSAQGELRENLEHNIAGVLSKSGRWFVWLTGPYVTIICLVVVMAIVFWHRGEVFEEIVTQPGLVSSAPIWARGVAFILDMVIISAATVIFMNLIHLDVSIPENISLSSKAEWDLIMQGIWEPSVLKAAMYVFLIICVVFLIYFTVFEYYFSATPGKMALQLQVFNLKREKTVEEVGEDTNKIMPPPLDQPTIGRLTLSQAIIRTLLRFIELRVILLVCFLMLISRRHQRPGDLLTKTMVVVKKPAKANWQS